MLAPVDSQKFHHWVIKEIDWAWLPPKDISVSQENKNVLYTKMLLPQPVQSSPQPPTLSAWLQEVTCWHDLDNTEYDCWPINSPNDYNMISCGGEFVVGWFGSFSPTADGWGGIPIVWSCCLCKCAQQLVECGRSGEPGAVAGLEMAWVQRPPDKVTNGEEFNVSYTVTALDSFYDYAVRNRIFQFGWVNYINTPRIFSVCHAHNTNMPACRGQLVKWQSKWPILQLFNKWKNIQNALAWMQLKTIMNKAASLNKQGLFGLTLWGVCHFQSLVSLRFLVEMHQKRGGSVTNTSAPWTGTVPMKWTAVCITPISTPVLLVSWWVRANKPTHSRGRRETCKNTTFFSIGSQYYTYIL